MVLFRRGHKKGHEDIIPGNNIVNLYKEIVMIKLMGIALITILLVPGFANAQDHLSYYRHNTYSHKSDSYFRLQQGWDISPRKASRAPNCYFYSLYVNGGRGSARIMSIPGRNHIQVENGQKRGYVCFNEPTTLELGKLSNANVYVELVIEDIGTFYFDRSDRGSRSINNWHRSYWGI